MTGLLEAVTVGAVVFASTNADDLVLLAAFFADERVPPRAVVLGQLLGIGTLTAVSAAAEGGVKAHAGHVLAVAGGTIANGGDNLGVYVPLFASRPSLVAAYAAVFAVLTGVWCGLGWWIVRNGRFGHHVRRHGRVLLPFVLVAVGLHVLRGAAPLFGG